MKNLYVLFLALAVAFIAPAAQAQPTPVFDVSAICGGQPDRLALAAQSRRTSGWPGISPPWVFTIPTSPWESFLFRPLDPSEAIDLVDAGWSISVSRFAGMMRPDPSGLAHVRVAPPSSTGTPPTYLTMDWRFAAGSYQLYGVHFAAGNSPSWGDYYNFAEYYQPLRTPQGTVWRQTAYLYCVQSGAPSLEFRDLETAGNTVRLSYNNICRRWDCENVWVW